jgi:hypothetical protein
LKPEQADSVSVGQGSERAAGKNLQMQQLQEQDKESAPDNDAEDPQPQGEMDILPMFCSQV